MKMTIRGCVQFKCCYFRDCITGERPSDLLAASRVGKVHGKNIWVLAKDCQIDEDGQLIPQERQEIVWISHLYKPKRGGNDPVWCDIAKPAQEL